MIIPLLNVEQIRYCNSYTRARAAFIDGGSPHACRPTVLVNVPTMVNHLVGHEAAADQNLRGKLPAASSP